MSFKLNLAKPFAYAALAAFLPVAAHAGETTTFSARGTTYQYTKTEQNGRTVIAGKTSDGKAFRLLVGNTIVTGQFDGQPVSFRLSEVRGSAVAVR